MLAGSGTHFFRVLPIDHLCTFSGRLCALVWTLASNGALNHSNAQEFTDTGYEALRVDDILMTG